MKDREPRSMAENLPEAREIEILPENIGELPVIEAAPLLERAASRIEIVKPKKAFWRGMAENLRGAAAYIQSEKSKAFRAIAGASLVATMVSACARPVEGGYPLTENAPVATLEAPPTQMPTAPPTPTTEPTLEPTPTPTEIPVYTGPLEDITEHIISRGLRPEVRLQSSYNEEDPRYAIHFPYPITLVSISTVSGTQISEQVWGFRLNDKDYRFRTRSAVCTFNLLNPVGDLEGLQIGEPYWPSFGGSNKPLTETEYVAKLLSTQSSDCRAVRGALRGYPNDLDRLMNFFTRGDASGFEEKIDENGIVDLTEVIFAYAALGE